MAVTVEKITLWRREVENKPGVLAQTLEPLASAGSDLQIVMGYAFPGNTSRGAIEVHPVAGSRAEEAAAKAGLSATSIPTLLVHGENRPGLGHAIARSLADAGINVEFLVTQVIGATYAAVFGFETEAEADQAAPIIQAS